MAEPLVTIGLPVSQEPLAYIRDAVRSVLNQSYANWELIIVSDGAPTETVKFLARFTDPRVRLIVHEESLGLASRLNEIAMKASGDYLARMDSDDIMMPGRLAHQLETLHVSGVDLVSGRAVIIDEHTRIVGQSRSVSTSVSVDSMFRKTPFIHPSVFARTSWFREHPYDESLLRSQDKALWIMASDKSAYLRDEEPILFYRVSSDLDPAKYLRSARFEREIIRRFGPPAIGRLQTAKVLVESLFKQFVICGTSILGRSELVIRRRYVDLHEGSQTRWEEILRQSVYAIPEVHEWSDGEESGRLGES